MMSDTPKQDLESHVKPDLPSDSKKWEALTRGTILASQTQAVITYVTIADQKAQVMLFINSLVMPFILQGTDHPDYKYPAIMAVLTASLTVFFAIMTVFPRGPNRFKKRAYSNELHFADIKQHETFDHYLKSVYPIYNDVGRLSQEAFKYMYDTSRYVLKAKYFWLRLCYTWFMIGNALCIIVLLASLAKII